MKVIPWFVFLALALQCGVAQAVSSYILGGGRVSSPVGSLQIIVDIAPELLPMEKGGVALGISSTNPGFLRFTSAAVHNPVVDSSMRADVRRWTTVAAQGMSDEKIDNLLGVSLLTPGLSTAFPNNPLTPNGTEFLYATIEYEILQPSGSTEILLFPGFVDEPFVNDGVIIEGRLTGTTITIPEPATLAMCGMGMMGLVLRRRNR